MSSPPPPSLSPTLASFSNNNNAPKRLLSQDNESRASPPQVNATPKPPKKRYLESTEFKDSTQASSQSSSFGSPTHPATTTTASHSGTSKTSAAREQYCNVGGPPILDVDTMNRVIEKALRGFSCDPSSSNATTTTTTSTSAPAAKNNNNNNNNSNNNKSEAQNSSSMNDFSISLKSREHSSSRNSSSSPKSGRDATSGPSSTNGTNRIPMTQTKTMTTSLTTTLDNSTSSSVGEDKPLNLSSSKVLSTSNQQIIDHYIDKFLSKKSTGAFTVPAEIMESPTLIGCKQGPFHQQTTSINKNLTRKERTCKGKRYLEMLSENKIAKRKASQMSDENVGKPGTSPKSNAAGSKWISGDFNLEEKIAELPQIEEKHLVNAYSKSVNGGKNSPVSRSPASACEDNTSKTEKSMPTRSGSPPNGQCDEDSQNVSEDSNPARENSVSGSSKREARERDHLSLYSKSGSGESEKIVANNKGGERFVSCAQGIECDGLTALAEVALQQAKRTEVTSTPAV